MKKRWLRIAGVVIAVLVLILVALPFLVNVNSFRPKIEEEASAALGRKVTLGNLKLSLFSGTVEADDIAIADNPVFSNKPFVTAHLLKVGVELMPLIFSKQIKVAEVSLIRGGPLCHAQLKARLIGTHDWQLGKRIALATLVGWLPLVLLAFIFPPHDMMALITDYKVAVRMLIAVPVLLIGQILMESRFRTIVSTIQEDLIRPQDFPQRVHREADADPYRILRTPGEATTGQFSPAGH